MCNRFKGIFFFAFLVTIFMLSACNSASTTGESQGNKSSEEAEKKHHLVISDVLPENHTLNENVWQPFIQGLEEKSDGRITSEIYFSNALGEVATGYDMAVTGTADISQNSHGFVQRNFPLTDVVEMPFFSNSAVEGTKILWQLYKEFPELQEEYADTIPLWLAVADSSEFYSATVPIRKPEDLRGLRVRTQGQIGNKIIEQLGGSPVTMPSGEMYEALQRGVVDVAFAAPATAKDFHLHEVAEYVTLGGFYSTSHFSVMNKETFNSMSESDQELILSLGEEMVLRDAEAFDAEKHVGYEAIKSSGAELIELTEEEKEAWREALQPVIDDWIREVEAQGYPAQKIYDRALELKNQ